MTKKLNLRLRAYELTFATLVGITATLIAMPSYADVKEIDSKSDLIEDYRPDPNALVEMHVIEDLNLPYKVRRKSGGFQFGFNYEIIRPSDYASFVDFASYDEMFGTSEIPVYQLQLGYKYNISAGGLSLNLGYGSGHISSDGSGDTRSLNITKTSLSGSYIMDMIFDEPYVAPYFSVGMAQFSLDEGINGLDNKHTNNYSMIYSVGLLVQMNWMDPTMTKDNLRNIGLENTYLDLFISKYDGSTSSDDPEMQTGTNLGIGLKLDF